MQPCGVMAMKPTRCPSCQSDDLIHGCLEAMFKMSFYKKVDLNAAACLACGAVIPDLGDVALDTLQQWQSLATEKASHEEL